ncbi:hypothetical protein B0H14DRAFT_3507301 [Mycena olivaceomarginata]|nr:hypothetical protein B0H14DRAFT_3507301 [Mycena olivaceomarginata]
MTRWLDSMPLLAYLRVANCANEFFGAFFRPQAPAFNFNPVASNLRVVDCGRVDPAILMQWAKDRHRFGTPLGKIYVSEERGFLEGPQLQKSRHCPFYVLVPVVARVMTYNVGGCPMVDDTPAALTAEVITALRSLLAHAENWSYEESGRAGKEFESLECASDKGGKAEFPLEKSPGSARLLRNVNVSRSPAPRRRSLVKSDSGHGTHLVFCEWRPVPRRQDDAR